MSRKYFLFGNPCFNQSVNVYLKNNINYIFTKKKIFLPVFNSVIFEVLIFLDNKQYSVPKIQKGNIYN